MFPAHFFKPLLPDFQSGLDIPLKFFTKYLEEGPHRRVVDLTSDISGRKWPVRLEGRRLTFGWKEFAGAHDYRVGDFVIFRYSGELHFHVTGMGPNCCELQYAKQTDDTKIGTLTVTNDTIGKSRLTVPKELVTSYGLSRAAGNTISLMNEAGDKWSVKMVKESGNRLRLTNGLTEFLLSNNFGVGNSFCLEVIWENGRDLVLKVVR